MHIFLYYSAAAQYWRKSEPDGKKKSWNFRTHRSSFDWLTDYFAYEAKQMERSNEAQSQVLQVLSNRILPSLLTQTLNHAESTKFRPQQQITNNNKNNSSILLLER